MYSDLIKFIRDWYQTKELVPLHEPRFREIDRNYVMDAIDSTFVSSIGEYVDRFEQKLAQYLGAAYAVATVNGTAALQTALRVAGVEQHNEVITQPLTFVATANAIVHNNAVPAFVDVNKATLGLCPDALEKFLDQNASKKDQGVFNKNTGRRIAAIIPMHTFGNPCRMEQIMELANYWNIAVVEDAAEALGSKISKTYCATFGSLGVLSFNGNKTITCGGGGAIITNDKRLAQKAKHLTTTAKVQHQWEFVHDEIGYNFRLPNLNAALACAQLEQVDGILNDKRKLARAYEKFFKESGWGHFVTEPEGCTSNYWLNAVITADKKQRDEFLKKTNESGIMTRPAWQLLPDLQIYKACQTDSLENARWLAKRIINLPSSARANV
ncbi:LegC family aminotransferase [Desulfobacula phenolica]|uniref:Aminotransferase, LLPSF_NHT_00031 family n=1 Tax=Desulfobacula phenolica TaxID=90732 RepID=A0A1H2DTA8_9BACT|nr:LegC family aminotransferase [Desulfobacula phenolica]SDT85668.1 aminotransferase, LLPSF_NHT_00031 family [Desulfobacula phenolica]